MTTPISILCRYLYSPIVIHVTALLLIKSYVPNLATGLLNVR